MTAAAPLVAGALGTALFLSLFGYWGLVHDARLYALQALAWLHPPLRQDLYLRFGSQDDYTLFSALFAPLTQALGLEGAALTLTLLSLLALFAATAYLLVRLSDPAGTLAGTLTVAMLPVNYGALSIFHVAEPFATPRPLAAALGLLAVAFALERRALAATLAAVAGLLVHPLIAWPAAVLALWVGVRPRLAAILTLAGALVLLLSAWAGAPVLARLLQVMDPEWKSLTGTLAPYLWTATWEASDWNGAAVALLSPLVVAARLQGVGSGRQACGDHPYVKVALAASLLGTCGLVAAAVLGDGCDNLLSLQLQPWRALWLSHWLGVAGLGLLLVRSIRTRDPADLLACLGLAGAELLIANTGGLSGVLLQQSAVAFLLVAGGWLVARFIKTPRVRRVALAAGLVLIGGLIAVRLQRSLDLARGSDPVIGSDPSPSRLVERLHRQGSLLWEGTPLGLWYHWHYPCYMHTLQLTGAVFSREKLMAARARIAHLEAVLGPLGLFNRETKSLDLPPPDARQIERLCADPQLAGIYYAGKQAWPGPTARAGAEGVLTIRNANGLAIGVLALSTSIDLTVFRFYSKYLIYKTYLISR